MHTALIALVLAAATAQATPAPSAADEAFARDDFATAQTLYRAEAQKNPQDSHALYRLAFIAAHDKRDAEALEDLANFAKIVPLPAGAYRTSPAFAVFRGVAGYGTFVENLEHAQYPCRYDPAARAMDGWVGTWTVKNRAGPGGRSVVTADFDGCAIVERWTGDFGDRGTSLTTYDAKNRQWLQHYVDDKGNATDYAGRAEGTSVVYLSIAQSPLTRMTYVFLPSNRVEQRFESSTDGGKTWSPVSDLFYER